MGFQKDVEYRLELARGFLNEAEQDYSLKRWRACVSGSILVLENTGLAVLMLFGVSPLTHKPGRHLYQLISEGTVPDEITKRIEEILPELDKHDSYEKMLAKYGDEAEYRLPWELFTEHEALSTIEAARKSMRVCSEIAELTAQ
ncbi:MAG: HEPN domain-containing protein [Chlorobiaceae bacterium]|jgi:HEPN domain-containing protein|nr:HEPN domain-containing protein [Chlorobiaceae bacterium]NTV16484.1 HEPN domain-containing protein [Chlorobiaceae bacterium]